MKAKITRRNKAKFMMQYYYQEVYVDKLISDKVLLLNGFEYEFPVHLSYIQLKPLSSLSDEDAIGVVEILCGTERNIKLRYNKDGTMRIAEIFTSDNQIKWKVNLDFSMLIVCYMGFVVEVDGYKQLEVYDFLRSRSFALPWMGLSVEEMCEAGWIKLVEKIGK